MFFLLNDFCFVILCNVYLRVPFYSKKLSFIIVIFLQLSSTKSMDGQRNLLHFIAEAVEDKYPEINGFELEISHVEQASRGKYFSRKYCSEMHRVRSFTGAEIRGVPLSDSYRPDCSLLSLCTTTSLFYITTIIIFLTVLVNVFILSSLFAVIIISNSSGS